VTYALEGPL